MCQVYWLNRNKQRFDFYCFCQGCQSSYIPPRLSFIFNCGYTMFGLFLVESKSEAESKGVNSKTLFKLHSVIHSLQKARAARRDPGDSSESTFRYKETRVRASGLWQRDGAEDGRSPVSRRPSKWNSWAPRIVRLRSLGNPNGKAKASKLLHWP